MGPEDIDDLTLQVLKPTGGDTLTAAGVYNIVWQTNLTTNVKIEYSSDGGASWNIITSSTDGDASSYEWDPVAAISSANCKIRVTSVDDKISDVSTGTFRIIPGSGPVLSLLTPNGGDILSPGNSYAISWISSEIGNIKIEFSSDGGSAWNTISSNYPADSSHYNWSVPDIVTSNGLIRISDVSSSGLADTSSSAFMIVQQEMIKVTAPNGGEEWPAKSNKIITWESAKISRVKIEYSNNNGVDWYTIEDSTESDGYYIWDPLPEVASTNAKIRISDARDQFPSDASDAVFTIAPEEALSIMQPNGGEQWLAGSTQQILWNGIKPNKKATGGSNLNDYLKKSPMKVTTVASVRVEYTTNSGSQWFTIAEDLPNNGSYTWSNIPSINSSLCKVRISDMQDGTLSDQSDSTFTIYNTVQQEIAVTSPAGGEIWQAGTTQAITWMSENVNSVKIEYTLNNGLTWNTIIASTPSDGYYNWSQVPSTASTNCRIRISDADDNFPSNFSKLVFTISPEPGVTVFSPNGGESLQAGSNTNIRWTSTNISDVRIEYTTNNGANWHTIINSTPSDGVYEWEVANLNSSLCRLRISDADDSQPLDISDNNFVITNQVVQSITLFSPNGGESWDAGTSHNVTWSASGITSARVEFTTNNGLDWTIVKDSVGSSGSVEWTPFNINSTQCKIRISDRTDGIPVDESDGPFVIKPIPSIEVIKPIKDEVIIAGESYDIKWKAVGVEKVRIEYTSNNAQGSGWITLVESTPSMGIDGTYSTSFSVPSTEYRVRVSDAEDGAPIAINNGVFTVAPQPVKTITITTPNGGENWLTNETYEIRWLSTNVDRVRIEYTLNGGATWAHITDTHNNGLYNWKVPATIDYRSDLCKIKLTYIVGDSITTLSDMTDNFFSIHPNSKMLRLVFPNGSEVITPEKSVDTVIQWRSSGVEYVKLELSIDNGMHWQQIFDADGNSADNLLSTGAFRWHLPNLSTVSTNARIRITDVSDDAGDTAETDMSDSYFNLNLWVPGFKIIDPGPKLNGGKEHQLQWQAPGSIKKVKLEYSPDGGKSWRLIEDNIPNQAKTNIYYWKSVPASVTNKALLRITDSSGKYKAHSSKFSIK